MHNVLFRIANREDSYQTASSEASVIRVCPVCLGIFGRDVRNFRTFTVYLKCHDKTCLS